MTRYDGGRYSIEIDGEERVVNSHGDQVDLTKYITPQIRKVEIVEENRQGAIRLGYMKAIILADSFTYRDDSGKLYHHRTDDWNRYDIYSTGDRIMVYHCNWSTHRRKEGT